MRTVQSWTCELGYGADTVFHRTYFLLLLRWYSSTQYASVLALNQAMFWIRCRAKKLVANEQMHHPSNRISSVLTIVIISPRQIRHCHWNLLGVTGVWYLVWHFRWQVPAYKLCRRVVVYTPQYLLRPERHKIDGSVLKWEQIIWTTFSGWAVGFSVYVYP